MKVSAVESAQPQLHIRLKARRAEIVEAVTARVSALADTPELNPEYAHGLREAIAAAIDYGLAVVELDEERVPPPPPALIEQARRAAGARVGLDTVLRRYFAGQAVIADFIVEESARERVLTAASLQRLFRAQAAVLDRVTVEVSAEYAAETERLRRSPREREARCVERLLAGERPDTSTIRYDFEGHHLALIAKGSGATEAIARIAQLLDRRLLSVEREGEGVWSWLGGTTPLEFEQLAAGAAELLPDDAFFALGEPAHGLAGWRISHQQARAALPIALYGPEPFVRYADVALLASIHKDDVLATSLREMYLKPLESERGRGEALRVTLRAYFATGRNASSAAALLGISRSTLSSRLNTIRERLGRPLEVCASELETALQLGDLDDADSSPKNGSHLIHIDDNHSAVP